MKTPIDSRFRLLWLVMAAVAVLALSGCSEDDPASPTETPDAEKAVALAGGVQGPAGVGDVMNDVAMFTDPMSDLAGDVGIGEDTPLGEGWDDGGVGYDFPDKARLAAASIRALTRTELATVAAVAPGGPKDRLERRFVEFGMAKAAGDTIAVEYYDTPDSVGLDALIETDEVDVVRLVSIREYLDAGLLQVQERESEIVIDTNGTLENGDDDAFHRVSHRQVRGNGEVSEGLLEPVSGEGPMGDGIPVRGLMTVENPSFHPLQAWTEAEMVLDPGEFRVEGDETLHSMQATVHWRNDAEHTVRLAPVEDEAIEPDTDLRVTALFTAAPENDWLESAADTLLVRMGDLEDESDDLLYGIVRAAVFDGTAVDGGSPRSYVRLIPDGPVSPGEEPCGGTAYQDVWYPQAWWLVHLEREADLDCDGSGQLDLLMEFRDGTSYTRTITWNGAGAATLTETRTDGTVVAGSYDENTGAYSLVTTFPDGHDPVSVDRHGTALDGSVEAWEIVEWQDEHQDETYFTATDDEGDFSAAGYRINGSAREDFTLESDDEGNVAGTWARNDGASGSFEVEMLEGGGHRFAFAASDPQADGSPSVEGEIFYAPDGSGVGTVTFTQHGVTVTFDIVIDPDGNGVLIDGDGNEHPM